MKPRTRTTLSALAGLAIAVGAFAGGIALRQTVSPAPEAPAYDATRLATAPAEALGLREHRPDFAFVDQRSQRRAISDYDGQVMVVNFWATWCPPCIDEIPEFVEAQAHYKQAGVQFVGIALDDMESVRDFIAEIPLNYPTAAGDSAAHDLMTEFGNVTGGLPFTAVVHADGRIAVRHAGPMNRAQLDAAIAEVM